MIKLAIISSAVKIVNDFHECTDPHQLCGRAQKLAEQLGFRHASYFLIAPFPSAQTAFHWASCPDWRRTYAKFNFVDGDPILGKCSSGISPFVWCASMIRTQSGVEQGSSLGFNSGIAAPVYEGPNFAGALNLYSAAHDRDLRLVCREMSGIVLLAAHHFHLVCKRISAERKDQPCPHPLSKRELECLTWVARGKTAWETARILDISERTVNFHIENCIRKLGATNRAHAIARLLGFGIRD